MLDASHTSTERANIYGAKPCAKDFTCILSRIPIGNRVNSISQMWEMKH